MSFIFAEVGIARTDQIERHVDDRTGKDIDPSKCGDPNQHMSDTLYSILTISDVVTARKYF